MMNQLKSLDEIIAEEKNFNYINSEYNRNLEYGVQ